MANLLLSGSAAPASSLGTNGDHYLRLTTFQFYKKVSGAWQMLGWLWRHPPS